MALVLLWTPCAHAHVERGQAAGFVTGFGHPWSGFDHVLAMMAVGIWGAQLGAPAVWLLPVVFPMVMAHGAFLGLIGLPLPGVEVGIALSALLLGAMVGGEVRPKLAVAALLVGAFAVFHGHAHGTELPAGQSGLLYSMGFVIATGCLHGLGIALGCSTAGRPEKLALRGAGALIAGMGVLFLWRGPDMGRLEYQHRWHRALATGSALLLWPRRAEAHLVTTGLGPVYDGVVFQIWM